MNNRRDEAGAFLAPSTAQIMQSVKIKRISTSRTLRLRVYEDGQVVLTAPRFVSQQKIDSFLKEHQEWIANRTSKAVRSRESLTVSRDELPFRGRNYSFRLNVGGKRTGARIENDKIVVTAPEEDHQLIRQILEKWYRSEAKELFEERVPLLADLIGRDLLRVSIRSVRTRWGSCSSRNTISLNWRLILAPDWVSDYVIYHELAHLTHMNHSNNFWRLVADYYPNYKEAEKWLKDNQQLLHF